MLSPTRGMKTEDINILLNKTGLETFEDFFRC